MIAVIRFAIIVGLAVFSVTAQSDQKVAGFSVFNDKGEPVKGIQTSDVRLRVDKKDTRAEAVNELADQALDLLILIDRSLSQERSLEMQKNAAAELVKTHVKPGRDRVAVASYADKITLHGGLQDDVTALTKAISSIRVLYPAGYIGTPSSGNPVFIPPGGKVPTTGGTAIWDSISESTVALQNTDSGGRRKVLLIFSDGVNTVGSKKRDEAVLQAAASNVSVFFAGIGDPEYSGIDRKTIIRFSEYSNGLALIANRKATDLNEIVSRLITAMRHSYTLSYRGGAGRIEIDLVARKEVSISNHRN
jgi:hypothetical protein